MVPLTIFVANIFAPIKIYTFMLEMLTETQAYLPAK
jgi:hypothetical protein